ARYFENASVLRRTPAQGSTATVIGYIGIIDDQEGVDNVVRMVRCLIDKYELKDLVCVIVGDGPALASVKSLAATLDIAEYFKFTGYLTGKDFLEALSEFDIG